MPFGLPKGRVLRAHFEGGTPSQAAENTASGDLKGHAFRRAVKISTRFGFSR
jgi:hypothetical protein